MEVKPAHPRKALFLIVVTEFGILRVPSKEWHPEKTASPKKVTDSPIVISLNE
jgi:hypothetical protein